MNDKTTRLDSPIGRLPELDALRGILILMIIFTHALSNLSAGAVPPWVLQAWRLLLTGTVRFATLSGLLFGYLEASKPGQLPRLLARYRLQGVRLLLVAHPLLVLALIGPTKVAMPLWQFALRSVYITDVLAVVFLMIPLIVGLTSRTRLVVALIMIFASPVLSHLSKGTPGLTPVRELLCDYSGGERYMVTSYGMLPLTAFFLIGNVVGRRHAARLRTEDAATTTYRLLVEGSALVGLSVGLLGLWIVGKFGPPTSFSQILRTLFTPSIYLSLYPFHLGTAYITLAALGLASRRSGLDICLRVLGRTSLFTYVTHYYIVQTLPWALGLQGSLGVAGLALLFVMSISVLIPLSAAWDIYRMRRRADAAAKRS